jgi:hypothetical protein
MNGERGSDSFLPFFMVLGHVKEALGAIGN